MKTKPTLVYGFLCVAGFFLLALISPPPSGTPNLPLHPYKYAPENIPPYAAVSVYTAGLKFVDDDKATLGRVLFYDTRLSAKDELSCASCHNQKHSFGENTRFSLGNEGVATSRNSPSLNDLGWRVAPYLFWDYREQELEKLVLQPILDEDELFGSFETIKKRMNEAGFYDVLFEKAFGTSDISEERIAIALADFVNAMTTWNSKYDKIARGEANFTAAEMAGKELFVVNCSGCHQMNSFDGSDISRDRNNALDWEYEDPGGGEIVGNNRMGIFKPPSLRNTALSAPYMHDGRLATLEDVVNFYSDDLKANSHSFVNVVQYYTQTSTIPSTGFGFNNIEKENLLAFLHTLTDETFINDPKFADPFTAELTSTEDLNTLAGISVYPNPATEFIMLEFPLGETQIEVHDASGKFIFSATASNGSFRLERKTIGNGMYSIIFKSKGKMSVERVVFQ